MNAARQVISDGILWIADGAISHVTKKSDATLDTHTGSPLIATAGTIDPGMIELHNYLACNALPLFRIPTYTIDWSCRRP